MNTDFCTQCGTPIVSDAAFCHKCGAKIESPKAVPKVEAAPSQPTHISYPPRRKRRIAGAIVGISLFLIVPIILIVVFGSINLVPLGTLEYSVESTDIRAVDLVIHNSVGSIDIVYDNTMTSLFEASIDVNGRPGSDIGDAKNFLSSNNSERLLINFESGEYKFFFWNKESFAYDITIYLNPLATVNFEIDADTGSVDFIINDLDNLEIENLLLQSNTGSVYATLIDAINTTFGDVNLTSDTGSVNLNLGDTINTTIQELYLATDTGRATCDLGEYTTLNDTDVTITSDTGSVTLSYENIILLNDIVWTLETDTGKVSVGIIQELVTSVNYTASFDMDTSTGSVYLSVRFDSAIGYSMIGSTGTGTIEMPGSGESYESPDFAAKGIKYYFDMDTSTGSIYVAEV